MKNRILSFFIIMISMILLVACGSSEGEDIPFYSTDEKLLKIEIENYELSYPIKWEKNLSVDIDGKDVCKVEFSTNINDEKIKLFNFIFDTKGKYSVETNGYKIGKISETDVFVEIYDNKMKTFTQDEKEVILGMIEDSNVVISKLIEDYNLELEKTE